MTLAEKLREAATRVHGSEYRRNMRMAADRIEKLEAALREAATMMDVFDSTLGDHIRTTLSP